MKSISTSAIQNRKRKTRFWILYHVGLLIFSIVTGMIIKYLQTGKVFVPELYMNIAIIFVISASLGYLSTYMVSRGEKMSHAELQKKMVPAFLIFLTLAFIIANVVVILGTLAYYLIEDIDLQYFLPNLWKYELSYASKSIIVWLMIFSIVFFYILWKKSADKEQQLREEKLKYQYQTLKAQINPHFLFNSFSALSELIYEDVKKADEYVRELSKIYRYIIDNEDKRLVNLQEELEFVHRYFTLQKVRSGNKISLTVAIDSTEKYEVIPVSIQSLIENAIKHNSASESGPLKINIAVENDSIVVRNNLQKKSTLESSTNKGLVNLNEQCRLILNEELQISENNNEFIVKIPVVIKA